MRRTFRIKTLRFLFLSLLWYCFNLNGALCFIPCSSSFRTRICPHLITKLQETANSNDNSDPSETQPSPSQCPFSKPFPRYRIDLTRIKEKKESSWFGTPFKKLSQGMEKSKLEQQCNKHSNQVFTWGPELDGIAAFSFLWDRAARLVSNTTWETSSSEVIALPDASRQLVQNWAEIIEWMGSLEEDGPLLEASFVQASDSDSSIPAVRIQRIKNLPATSTSTNVEVLVNDRTRAWVKRILVEQGICPFTKSDRKSGQGLGDLGVPVGSIAYHGSVASHPISLFADTWRAILEMIRAGPGGKDGISSILLAAPAFDDDFDRWAGPIFAILEAGVVVAQAQAEIGVVCFHPKYATPDGTSWPGFGHMHSVPRLEKWYQEHSNTQEELSTEEVAAGGAWQRRTPHATINVLRADQLEAAESRRTSGELYAENIEKLVGATGIGSNKLALDLERERDMGL